MFKKYKYHKQLDQMDCGPTCLKMIASQYGKDYSVDTLRESSFITRMGVSLLGLGEAAEKIGFRSFTAKLTLEQLIEEVPLPCILHWNQEHFVVLFDVKQESFFNKKRRFIIGDPGHNLVTVSDEIMQKCWVSTDKNRGVALLLEPTPDFYASGGESRASKDSGSGQFLLKYLLPFKSYFYQILVGMIFSSLLALVFPFLTQSIVDYGIQRKNYDFISLILLSQLLLFVGGIAVDLIKNWILLHINTRISVSIISDFLMKLFRLPISFFETKNLGDITQRINDHKRIESFLTGSTLQTLFSLINLVVFSVVLGLYNYQFLLIFSVGSLLSVVWVLLFLKKRKQLDYTRFQQMRENQNSLFELINGMQEIKLNNCERPRRWNWERIQANLFKVNIKSLALEQYQEVGSSFITQLKNILISYMAALAVINNEITLGVMLSISYIVGQMNGPLAQMIAFIRQIQDAKMSLERLSEIHNRADEEANENELILQNLSEDYALNFDDEIQKNNHLVDFGNKKKEEGILIKNLSFRYGPEGIPNVLSDINLFIPEGKVTAIVGSSGSGKTTLLKLLLKFYAPTQGEIKVNGKNLKNLSSKSWRSICGSVMQDGFIFSDTLLNNIAVDGEQIDKQRLSEAIITSNLVEYIKKLPLGLLTKVGNTGSGMSGGQKQRLFIARVIYKQPNYLFFDEATSALDANNEKVILENLQKFFKNKTVVVIAHRLSTVKNADQIVVLDNGKVEEIGSHEELVEKRGKYFELIKNQLELANA